MAGSKAVRRVRMMVAVAGAAVLAAACIGSISESELQAKVRARGGGIGQQLPGKAVTAVEERLGGGPVEIVTLAETAGQVTLEVRVPGSSEDVDAYRYGSSGRFGGRGLDGPEPVPVTPGADQLDDRTFPADRIDLDDLDAVVEVALDEADLPGGYVSGLMIHRLPSEPDPIVVVTVTDDRRSTVVTFAADGTLRGTETT